MPKPRILIAEDEEGIRESLTLVLDGEYELLYAKDGEEALAAIGRQAPDLVLLDIKMPKLDGMDVLRRLREQPGAPPVLMLTAYQSVELAREAINLGARDYLTKPFDREQVRAAIRGALR
jgi:DNA-binding response OmpR family regulator